MAASTTAPAAVPSRWLHGPWRDLLFGCGLLYAALAIGSALSPTPLSPQLPQIVAPLLILLVSTPHYGATLLRVYERSEDRRRYQLFSVYVSLLLLALFCWGVFDDRVVSVLVTVYFTWSPWHYTGQNYGISVMFLRRRGVDFDDSTRRALYVSFIASFFVVALVQHSGTSAMPDSRLQGVRFLSLGISTDLSSVLVPLAGLVWAAAVVVAIVGLRRAGSWRDIAPTLAVVLLQALWFSVPFLLRFGRVSLGVEAFDWQWRTQAFLWIAAGHAAQYLWVSSYYARSADSFTNQPRYYGKVIAAGTSVWLFPAMLLGPGTAMGAAPAAGFALLLASCVNLHHFVLDGVIWKLRHARIASVLIRDVSEEADGLAKASSSVGSGLWRGRIVWGAATVAVALSAVGLLDRSVALPAALRGLDNAAAVRALDRLAWLARDDATARQLVGRRLANQSRGEEAIVQLERSLALQPTAAGFDALGRVYASAGNWELARENWAVGLALSPDDPGAMRRLSAAERHLGSTARADELLRAAATIDPNGEKPPATADAQRVAPSY